MRVGVIANARAGKGRAGALVQGVEAQLRARGHVVETRWVGQGEPWALGLPERLLIAGGDGTVHQALPLLARERTPFLPLPAGTENLLAKQWRVGTEAARIAARVERGEPVEVDAGACEGRLFALMGSVGPDASVIHRVQAKRGARITHWTYAGPIWREALSPAIATLRWRAEGGAWSAAAPGVLIVANSPMYARGANPCRAAEMTDGVLDVLFMGARTTLGVARWGLRAMRGRAWGHARAGCVQAGGIEVEHVSGRLRVQLDGEPAEARGTIRFVCLPKALRIIGER